MQVPYNKQMMLERLLLLIMGVGLVLVLNAMVVNLAGVFINLYDLRRLLQLSLMGFITGVGLLYWPLYADMLKLWQGAPKWLRYGSYIFLALGFLSACHARIPRYAFLQWGHDILLVFDALVVTVLAQRQGRYYWQYFWLWLFVSVVTLLGLRFAIYYYLTQVAANAPIISASYFVNPTYVVHRFLAQVISWTWPILVLPLCLRGAGWRWRFLQGLTLIVASGWWSVAILNQSRALMLEWFFLAVLIPFVFRRAGLRWLGWQVVTAVLGLIWFFIQYDVLYSIFFPAVTSLFRQADSYLGAERFELYRVALVQMLHHPWLGVGPMFYADIAGTLHLPAAHPHNALLCVGVEWGLLAMLIFASIWAWAFFKTAILGRKAVKMADASSDVGVVFKLCFFASLSAASLHALVSGVLIMPASQTLFIFVIAGLMMAYLPSASSQRVIEPGSGYHLKHGLLKMLIVVSVIAVVNGILPMWGYWNKSLYDYQNLSGERFLKPNYWQQGLINYWPLSSQNFVESKVQKVGKS